MAARAIWKGIIRLGEIRVPVKLYSAVEDRNVRFRLLHQTDKVPVRQELVNPETDEVVPYSEAKRGLVTGGGDLVVFEPHELEDLEPQESRDIEVLSFLPAGAIDHRWFLRPYYLGPDGDSGAYWSLIHALESTGREGVVRWTMRKKEYAGALTLYRGYPMLITLRSEEQVVSSDAFEVPEAGDLDERELGMARQLMEMLEGSFEPESYRDEYRERVEALIAAKARGGTVKTRKVKRERPYEDLSEALRASLERERIRA